MSLVPFFLEDDQWIPRSSVIPFSGRMFRDDILERPWRSLDRAVRNLEHSSGASVIRDKDKFQVALDVHQFTPAELSVVVKGKEVVVEGKHEEKQDEHGHISRHFVRRYSIPEGHKPEDVISNLSSDGVLTVTAPRHKALAHGERAVPIQATGSVHQAIKQDQKAQKDAKMQE